MDTPGITVAFSPRFRAVLARLDQGPAALRGRLIRVLDRENQLTIAHIQRTYLSARGPETLGVRTNRLRSSLQASPARTSEGGLAATIGTNVRYAGVHEFGFVGPVQVRAFTRASKSRDVFTRIRLEPVLAADGSLARRARTQRQRSASGVSFVRAHTRQVSLPARAPLGRGLADRAPDYVAALEAAAADVLTPPPGGGASSP